MKKKSKSTWGGKRVSTNAPALRNTVVNEIAERAAGDWIPIGMVIGKGKQEPEPSNFFYSFDALDDGYKVEEILALEDMYLPMYNRVTGGK